MTSQDANIPVFIIDAEDKQQSGVLKMQHNNGNVSLSFYREIEQDKPAGVKTLKKYSQIPDHVYQLSNFTKVEMSAKDNLLITLSGSRSKFAINFLAEDGLVSFFDYVGQKVHFKHSDCNPRVFLLESLDSTDVSIAPFMATVLPTPKHEQNIAPNRVSKQKIRDIGKKIVFENPEPSKKFTKEDLENLMDEEGKIKEDSNFPNILFNVDIDPEIIGDIWKLILGGSKMTKEERQNEDSENLKVYDSVKQQWMLTTRKQWDNHKDLRTLVASIEGDIKANTKLFEQYEDQKAVQKVAFNILLTTSYYCWDKASYVEGMVHLLAPFVISFVKSIEQDGIVDLTGKKRPVEEVESDIFWVFFKFYEQNDLADTLRPSKKPIAKRIFTVVGNFLESHYQALLELLLQKQAYSLDFMRGDVNTWFAADFAPADVGKLWISILATQNTETFFEAFVVSLFFALSPRLVELNPLNNAEFVDRFHELKTNVDLTLLLVNTRELLTEIAPAAK